jgi:hypothetical protein
VKSGSVNEVGMGFHHKFQDVTVWHRETVRIIVNKREMMKSLRCLAQEMRVSRK